MNARTLVDRLRNASNWMRQGFEDWKQVASTYDRAPFDAADEIERLQRELGECQVGYDSGTKAIAENLLLRKDAERYRWLRDTGAVFTVRSSGVDGRSCMVYPINRQAEGLDDAIDAATAAVPAVGAA